MTYPEALLRTMSEIHLVLFWTFILLCAWFIIWLCVIGRRNAD